MQFYTLFLQSKICFASSLPSGSQENTAVNKNTFMPYLSTYSSYEIGVCDTSYFTSKIWPFLGLAVLNILYLLYTRSCHVPHLSFPVEEELLYLYIMMLLLKFLFSVKDKITLTHIFLYF